VIVDDLDVKCISGVEPKTHAVLIVDPDAVLPDSIPHERFQSIIRRNAQIIQSHRSLQHGELPHRDFFNIRESRNSRTQEQSLGVSATEGLDHEQIVLRRNTIVKRDYVSVFSD
jgi:hypothetical protein